MADPVKVLADLLTIVSLLDDKDPREARMSVVRTAEHGDVMLILPWGKASISCDEIRRTLDPQEAQQDRNDAYKRIIRKLWREAGTWKKGH